MFEIVWDLIYFSINQFAVSIGTKKAGVEVLEF
jgi:hypothetical protein